MSQIKKRQGGKNLVWMSIIYLFGLFIGAIDTGIITPARPIIQSQLGVEASLGIWMITIYTLTYAAIIPISGKLADMKGRKPVYLLSIAMFGTGSVICAISAGLGSFTVLMLGRVVQAAGAGGIMPVATAEFGTSFPEEKRGMALGLVGAVYGIANVLGASVGSLVLNIAGVEKWQWIFLINVPICVFIVVAGILVLPNNKADETKAMDKLGTLLMTVIILALLYGLKNLDFFNFLTSIKSVNVWPFLLGSLVLIPLFVVVEKRAEDPIFHIEYASNRQIMVTLILGLVVGCSMMGMIFIPQFAENCLCIPSGSGGYFVIILGVFSGGASMISGKLIDKRGAKPVMAAGFIITIIGCLYLSFVAIRYVNLVNVIVSLVIIGFGLGLTMGTPLNYMMLQNTSDEESNSALATLSLVRSIGTAVAPAIMVGFIVHAAMGLQGGLMDILPKEVSMPALPYAQEIDETLERYKNDPEFAKQMGDMEMPKLSEMTTMEIQMSGNGDSSYEMPADILDKIQNSDVTTITDNTVELVERMFGDMSPNIIAQITEGIDAGIKGIDSGVAGIDKGLAEMQEGYDGIGQGINGMNTAIAAQDEALAQLQNAIDMLRSFKNGLPQGMTLLNFIPKQAQSAMPQSVFSVLSDVRSASDLQSLIDQMDAAADSMSDATVQLDSAIAMMNRFPDGKISGGQTLGDVLPPAAKEAMPAQTLAMLSSVTEVSQLEAMKTQIESGIAAQQAAKEQLQTPLAMLNALAEGRIPDGMSMVDFMPASAKEAMPDDTLQKLQNVKTVDDLESMADELSAARATVAQKLSDAEESQKEMGEAMDKMKQSSKDMKKLSEQLSEVKIAVPDAFKTAGENYVASVRDMSDKIEDTFQGTVNSGYRNMYLFQVGANALGLLVLLFYREPRRKQEQ